MTYLSIWNQLITWDRTLFEKINSDWTNPFFDNLMPFLRNSTHWAPLYLFLGIFALMNFKTKGIWWLVLFAVTIAMTDMTGTYILKHNIERIRPCNDPLMADSVRLLLPQCAGGYSFISNHAANHFGMGIFFLVTMKGILKKWAWVGVIWAVLIAYSQVYVGVHYPGDVLAGALLGVIFGLVTGTIFNKRFGFAIFVH